MTTSRNKQRPWEATVGPVSLDDVTRNPETHSFCSVRRTRLTSHAEKTPAPTTASVATRHFEQEAARKAQELEAARSKVRSPKKHVAPLPVDYFTKLGGAEAAARAEEKKARAAGQMPAGVKHFTDKKEAATAAEVSEEHMTAAGKHFHRASKAEKEEQAQAA